MERAAEINKNSFALTDIEKNNSQYPGITLLGDVRYVCWQSYSNGHDSLMAARLDGDKTVDVVEISGEGEVLRPVMKTVGENIWVVWSEGLNRRWSIKARCLSEGSWGETITIDEGIATFYPSLAVDGDKLIVIWSSQTKGSSQTKLTYLTVNGVEEIQTVSLSGKTYRPSCAIGNDGNLYVTYDRFNGKHYDVIARVNVAGSWSEEHVVSTSTDWAANPIAVAANEGVTIGWYDFGEFASFSYTSSDVSYKEGKLTSTAPDKFSHGVDWYQNIDLVSNKNGVQVFAYTWGKYDIHVRYRVNNGSWSQPTVMSYNDGHCGVHPKVFVDDNNVIHLLWQFAWKNGHFYRNASIVYNSLPIGDIDKYADISKEQGENAFTKPIRTPKTFPKHSKETIASWLDKNGYDNTMLTFGDIHGQSGISDGVGEIDQYYHMSKVGPELDFTALTDHDCYPDWISQSEWEWMRTTNSLMNTDGELACILAFEWTPNEHLYDFGHKNVYYRGDDGEMCRSGEDNGMTPPQLFETIKKYNGQCIPHHPAADWGHVSAATDWAFHDPEAQRLVEIFSRHAIFEDFESQSIYAKNIKKFEGKGVQDALARKYRLGIVAGSDSHQMEHGVEGGIMAAFVPSLTRENVYDAMYNRNVYAVTGARMLLSLKVNGCPMGSEVTLGADGNADSKVDVAVSVLAFTEAKVDLIKNNKVVKTVTTTTGDCDFTFEDVGNTDDYYYIRVTQKDDHMAWSSPIWVDKN